MKKLENTVSLISNKLIRVEGSLLGAAGPGSKGKEAAASQPNKRVKKSQETKDKGQPQINRTFPSLMLLNVYTVDVIMLIDAHLHVWAAAS